MIADRVRGALGALQRDRRLVLLSAGVAAIYGLGLLGLALLPLLARDHPLLLIALNPTTSVLLLVSGRVATAPFVAVALVRPQPAYLNSMYTQDVRRLFTARRFDRWIRFSPTYVRLVVQGDRVTEAELCDFDPSR